MKYCSKCKVEKESSEFYPKSKYYCKKCASELKREYYYKNKDKVRVVQKKWVDKNREYLRNYLRNWRLLRKQTV